MPTTSAYEDPTTIGTNFEQFTTALLYKKNTALSERNAVLQRELHQAQFLIADLRQYHDKHQQLVHTLTSSKAEVEALKDELAALEQEKQKLKDNNSDLETCLKTTQAEVLVATEELSSVKKLLKDSKLRFMPYQKNYQH